MRVEICERTFEFARRVIRLCRAIEDSSAVSRALERQLMRSGTSVGANVEEAQAGQSRADFIAKMSIAVKEARETRYWLRLLSAEQILPPGRLEPIVAESDELVRILATIVSRTREGSSRAAPSSGDPAP